uniref:Uncharacterized protein n=1 Tax=Sphaerodactylus townsendi TaxID=933632 RepID=A0ACB8EST7_9SAUR
MTQSVTVTRRRPRSPSRYRRHIVPNRAFDFLYGFDLRVDFDVIFVIRFYRGWQETHFKLLDVSDPLYFLSSERDHLQATVQSHVLNDEMKKLPVFKTMFSNLVHYPRYTMKLEEKNPVPPFIDRRWKGRAQQRLEALQKLSL